MGLAGPDHICGTNNKNTQDIHCFVMIWRWACEPLGEASREFGLQVEGLGSHGGDLGGHVETRRSTWALLGRVDESFGSPARFLGGPLVHVSHGQPP